MKLNEVKLKQYQSATILNESWQQLTEAQQLYVGRWESRVWPLVEQYSKLLEQELTTAQIQKIFTSAEQVAKDTGTNQTALGKAGQSTSEVTGKMKAEIEKLAKQAQSSGPVKNMDAQFDKLRKQISDKMQGNPAGQKILQGVDKWKTFAEENPAKSSFIIGAMTSILAFASAGVVSGAAIGFFLRLANNTIKGDKLSTALGKGVKGAAIGAVAGALGSVVSGLDIGEPEFEGGPADVDITASSDEIASAGGEEAAQALADMTEEQFKEAYARELLEKQAERFNMPVTDSMVQKIADNIEITGNYPDNYDTNFEGTFVRGTTYLTPDEAAEYNRIVQSNGGGSQGAFSKEASEFIKDAGAEGPNVVPDGGTDPETDIVGDGYTSDNGYTYTDDEINSIVDKAREQGKTPSEIISDLVDSKDVDAGDYSDEVMGLEAEIKQKGINILKVPESLEEQLWTALAAYELQEAPNFMAAMGGAASKTANAVGKAAAKGVSKAGAAAKSAGNELGNKVTAKKLMRMWNKAGKPADMGSVVNILQSSGLSAEQIQGLGKEQGVDLKSKNVGDKEEPASEPNAQDVAQNDTDSNKDAQNVAQKSKTKPIQKGAKLKVSGKEYEWQGALWTDVSTGRPLGIQASINLGLPNPKIDPVADAIKKAGPEVIKMVVDQINSSLAKPKQAKVTPAKNPAAKAGIAKPGTVAAKPKTSIKKVPGKV